MKRIAAVFLSLLCLCLLAGCRIAQLLEQTQNEKSDSASQHSSQAESSPEQPGREVSAFAPKPPTAAPSADEHSLSRYFGMSFAQLVEAYGPSEIYHWYDLGLYSSFEGVPITFCFDFDIIDGLFPDVSEWVMTPTEFSSGEADLRYNFETGAFGPPDFTVAFILVGGEALEQLLNELAIRSPATLEALNAGFGQDCSIEEFLMTGELQAGMYVRDGYQYEFTFDSSGSYVTSARMMPLDGSQAQPEQAAPSAEEVLAFLMTYEEVQYLTEQGLTPLIEMERVFIEGNLCYTVSFGTNHAESFVRERHFAASPQSGLAFEYDVVSDSYFTLGLG